MRDAGLSMSMGSDDPAMGGTTLAGDYGAVATALGFDHSTFAAQNHAALDASWLGPEDKQAVRDVLDPVTP